MKIKPVISPNFGWNKKTHIVMTEEAAKDNAELSKVERRMLGRFSQMPDVDPRELVDMISPHFYDVLHPDPCFGTKNDARNNALSRFMSFSRKALKSKDRETFLRHMGYAAHYLQDVSTPPHTEHGNYAHKLYRVPMHKMFEKWAPFGASTRLDSLVKNFVPEEVPFSTLQSLLHNTALYTVQPENKVRYYNISKWSKKQQRCFNKGVNATKAYFDYMLQYIPKRVV